MSRKSLGLATGHNGKHVFVSVNFASNASKGKKYGFWPLLFSPDPIKMEIKIQGLSSRTLEMKIIWENSKAENTSLSVLVIKSQQKEDKCGPIYSKTLSSTEYNEEIS